MTTVEATFEGYTIYLVPDPAIRTIHIVDPEGHWVGAGQLSPGGKIVGCAFNLEEKIFEGLEEALSEKTEEGLWYRGICVAC